MILTYFTKYSCVRTYKKPYLCTVYLNKTATATRIWHSNSPVKLMHQTPQVVSTKRKYNVMVFNKICCAASASLLLFSIAQSALAQDLIASQAPIERKQKAVDSLTITRLVEREIIETPSTDLYSS